MKVLTVTNMYPTLEMPFYGIFVKEQVESLRKEGIHVDVAFINGGENRWNYARSVTALVDRMRSKPYDLIHCHHTYCVYLATLTKVLSRTRAPLVLTFHEGGAHKNNHAAKAHADFIRRLVYVRSIKKVSLRMVDMVITVEEELAKELGFKGRWVVLPCGVDPDLFRPMDREACRRRLNLPMERKIVLFPASPEKWQKGLDILNEALKILGDKNIKLVVGGAILHEDMPYYMCASDVVVQASFFEASPMVLKEAMAVNVPVVFTDSGDARLTMGDARGCFLCERTPEDVALKLSEALRCEGKSEGRRRILEEGLTLSDISKKIVKIYEDVLQNR